MVIAVAAGDFPKEHQLHSKYFARNLSLEEARQMGWLVGWLVVWLVGWLVADVGNLPVFLGGIFEYQKKPRVIFTLKGKLTQSLVLGKEFLSKS